MTVDAYIFDLDDTIIDSSIYKKMYSTVIKELMQSLGMTEIEIQQSINKVKEEFGKPDTFELAKRLNATEVYYKVLERYLRHTYSLKTKEIPKLFKKIKDAKKRIGIASRSQERTIEMFLTRFSLMEYVDFIQSGNKESVSFWLSLEKKHNLDKEKTMLIDDSQPVLDTAKHVGFLTLNVRDIEELEGFGV